MSELLTEVVASNNNSFIKIKDAEREEIERKTAEFLKSRKNQIKKMECVDRTKSHTSEYTERREKSKNAGKKTQRMRLNGLL